MGFTRTVPLGRAQEVADEMEVMGGVSDKFRSHWLMKGGGAWLAVVLLFVAAFLARLLLPLTGAFITFYPAVFFAALLRGWRGGLAVLVMALIASIYFLDPPGTLRLDANAVYSLIVFLTFGAAIILAVELLQRTVARARLAAQELESQQRFTNAVIDAAPSLTYVYDLQRQRNVFISRQSLDVLGHSPEDVTAMGSEVLATLLHPDDLKPASDRFALILASRDDRLFELQYRMRRKDGSYVWLLSRDRVFKRDSAGKPLQILGVATDITERKQAEDSLAASESRFRGVFENAPTGISISDMQGRFEQCNPAYVRMFGYSEEELRHMPFSTIVHLEDRQANLAELDRLLRGEVPYFEIFNRSLHKDGHTVWVHKFVTTLRDSGGQPASIVALVTDLTERKRYEEQIRLLMREVNHRSKNLLAVVQSVARQTASHGDPASFADRFADRLHGLAASHDLLVNNAWRGVALRDLVESQLSHFADLVGKRIRIDGPPLKVNAATAQSLGMVLHELATNAGKYGALSDDLGRVDILWRLSAEGEAATFHVTWTESGGPRVTPPERRGLGSRIISPLAEQALSGKVVTEYRPEGLIWSLDAPAANVLEQNRSDLL